MVEMIGVKANYVSLPALVLAMAYNAFDGLLTSQAAMVSTSRGDVPGDAVMTVQAQGRLVVLVEMNVTLIAVRFDFRVSLDQLSRHQQHLLEVKCRFLRVKLKTAAVDHRHNKQGSVHWDSVSTCVRQRHAQWRISTS
jgi:hypothetical protein